MNKNQLIYVISLLLKFLPSLVSAFCLRFLIFEKKLNSKSTIFYKKTSKKPTMLALDCDRYRGDLEGLVETKKIRVLFISHTFQRFILRAYLPENVNIFDIQDIQNEKLQNIDKDLTNRLKSILGFLKNIVHIDFVTNVHFKYIEDYHYTKTFEELGIPHIMLYRECNLMSPIIYDIVQRMMEKMGAFRGTHIIVHNDLCKKVFIDAGFATEDKLTVAGAIRMENFVKKFKFAKSNIKESNRKKFTLFYFPYDSSMFGSNNKNLDLSEYFPESNYWEKSREFFFKLHNTIIDLSINHPKIDFIIKPKFEFTKEKSWKVYQNLINTRFPDEKLPANYKIDPFADVHKLINESSLICGGQSSTTIESLFLNKPVIIPVFCKYRQTAFYKQFPWRDYEHLFQLTETREDFIAYFERIFVDEEEYTIDREEVKSLYVKIFSESSVNAKSNYVNTIMSVINKNELG